MPLALQATSSFHGLKSKWLHNKNACFYASMQKNKYPYQKEWREYRRRRNFFFAIFLFGLFVIYFVVSVSAYIAPALSHLLFPLFFAWPILSLIFLLRFHNWECPMCGKLFFKMSRWTPSPVMQTKCNNCGLPKYKGSRLRATKKK
jgi:hypothetical protein